MLLSYDSIEGSAESIGDGNSAFIAPLVVLNRIAIDCLLAAQSIQATACLLKPRQFTFPSLKHFGKSL